ncbi:NAD-dependent malic enzyme, partial [Lactobacillus sp. XV13L]|nr:NAD-dependent malic enzyme [Lactobacillus sp. XV13L]
AGAAVIATGSSKYPNQVNNILAFPGLFKGLLDSSITKVDAGLQKVVAQALAQIVTQPTTQKIIPDVFDKQVVATVSQAVQDYSQQQK